MTRKLIGTEIWCQVCKWKIALFRGQKSFEVSDSSKIELTKHGMTRWSYYYSAELLLCKGNHPNGDKPSKAIEVYDE